VRRVLDKEKTNADAFLLQGKLYLKLDQADRALEPIEVAIKLQVEDPLWGPPKANSFFYLGMALERVKDFKKGMQNFKKALTIDNNHFGSCIHLANLLANLGEGQRAAKYFKHALKIDPDSVNAHFGLGKAVQQYSEDREAPIHHFEEVLKRDPMHYKALSQLGILYIDREEHEKAAEVLKKALEVNKTFPLALVTMGNLLFETGRADRAIKYHL
jgi:tetratricopeptide (TPR) repeat protein